MNKNGVHFMSESNEWGTPQALFDRLDREFHFTLDPCATSENAKCNQFFTVQEDGLTQPWVTNVVFVNSPYGREIGWWVKKAYKETGTTVVLLIPSRTDTAYWHDYCMLADEIRLIRGRIAFVSPTGKKYQSAPFPSAIVVFRPGRQGPGPVVTSLCLTREERGLSPRALTASL